MIFYRPTISGKRFSNSTDKWLVIWYDASLTQTRMFIVFILAATQQPIDYSGFGFYLDNQSKFCAYDYAKFAGIDVEEIDLDSIKSVIDAANDLPDWNTIKVEHF